VIIGLMGKVTTITVSVETKELLERLKGGKTWEEFLRGLAEEMLRERRERVRKRLGELLEAEFEEVRVRGWAREY